MTPSVQVASNAGLSGEARLSSIGRPAGMVPQFLRGALSTALWPGLG